MTILLVKARLGNRLRGIGAHFFLPDGAPFCNKAFNARLKLQFNPSSPPRKIEYITSSPGVMASSSGRPRITRRVRFNFSKI
jgi:hypothetical protein